MARFHLESQNPHLPAAAPAGLLSRKITGEVIPAASSPEEPEQNGVLAILRLVLGAGVTPAQGSMKPTVGFILIKWLPPPTVYP